MKSNPNKENHYFVIKSGTLKSQLYTANLNEKYLRKLLTMDAIVDTLKNKELPDVKIRLDEISEDLGREGLYFATYQNLKSLLIVTKDIETTSFDLKQDMDYDVLITKTNKDLKFSLAADRDSTLKMESKPYYTNGESSNLIKVLQTADNVSLDTNFPSKLFNIKVDGRPMPAIIFSKEDLK